MEVINLARNASHLMYHHEKLFKADLNEPALVRRHSNNAVVIEIPKLSFSTPEKVKEAPVMINTGDDVIVDEQPLIPICAKTLECGHTCQGV